jgi:hypothetical protein
VLYPSGSCPCKWLASISIFLHPFYANVSTCPPPGTGILSFGLVAIPVRIHTATHSENVSFHLLDNKCGSRVRNQHYCPVCNVVVERAELVELNYLFPTPFFLRGTLGGYNKLGAENERLDDTRPRAWSRFTYLTRLNTYFDVADNHSIELGTSFAYTPSIRIPKSRRAAAARSVALM